MRKALKYRGDGFSHGLDFNHDHGHDHDHDQIYDHDHDHSNRLQP